MKNSKGRRLLAKAVFVHTKPDKYFSPFDEQIWINSSHAGFVSVDGKKFESETRD